MTCVTLAGVFALSTLSRRPQGCALVMCYLQVAGAGGPLARLPPRWTIIFWRWWRVPSRNIARVPKEPQLLATYLPPTPWRMPSYCTRLYSMVLRHYTCLNCTRTGRANAAARTFCAAAGPLHGVMFPPGAILRSLKAGAGAGSFLRESPLCYRASLQGGRE